MAAVQLGPWFLPWCNKTKQKQGTRSCNQLIRIIHIFMKITVSSPDENLSWLAPKLSSGTVLTERRCVLSDFHKFIKGMTSGRPHSILRFPYLLFLHTVLTNGCEKSILGPLQFHFMSFCPNLFSFIQFLCILVQTVNIEDYGTENR
jgi:hypothetical protein